MEDRFGARAWVPGLLLPALLALAPPPRPAAHATSAALAADQVSHCTDAEAFLADSVGMAVRTEPDTLDDWRTHQRVAGCRVTAAGVTRRTAREAAADFYDAVRAAGWTRTPDPRDAPNEASLRFRMNGSDCLFNVYTGGILGTDAELAVDAQRVPMAGQLRYNVLALCLPAMDAAK